MNAAAVSHEAAYVERVDVAQEALRDAEHALAEATVRAKNARTARTAVSVTASDKELVRLREADEIAQERVAVATRARDSARSKLVSLSADLKHATAADEDLKISDALERMRALVRKARALRREADRIDTEDIAPLWNEEYLPVSGLKSQVVDHRVEAPDDRPRDLADLYDATARLDGEAVPKAWDRTPAGLLAELAMQRVDATAAADLARNRLQPEPGLAKEHRDQLAHCLLARGHDVVSDLQLSVGVPIEQLQELVGFPTNPIAAFIRVPVTFRLEAEIAKGLPRAMAVAASIGKPFDPSAIASRRVGWYPQPPAPPPRENQHYEYSEVSFTSPR